MSCETVLTQGWFEGGGGRVKNPPTLNVITATSQGCFCVGPCWDLGMFQDIVYISSEQNVSKTKKKAIFNRFAQIWSCCDLEMTAPWPLDNSPMKPNTNPCHHMYLGWARSIYWKCWSNNLFKRNIFEQNSFPLTVCICHALIPPWGSRVPYFDDPWWPCPCMYNLQSFLFQ